MSPVNQSIRAQQEWKRNTSEADIGRNTILVVLLLYYFIFSVLKRFILNKAFRTPFQIH